MVTKRVCVIGAGVSGLTSIKACLEENLEVVCFEKTSDVGGLWNFRYDVYDGVATVMKSTVINSSKEMSSFSDFPPPSHFANFMHNKMVCRYLKMYANHFHLIPCIRFRTTVIRVERAEDYEVTGRWMVRYQTKDSVIEEEVFDGVIIASGHHAYPKMPYFEGLDTFRGSVIHTHSYKDFKEYEDKRVLVVGIGNSGGDVAVELSRVSDQVYLSTRRGTWVFYRVGDFGIPTDIHLKTRLYTWFINNMPNKIVNYVFESKGNSKADHALYNLKPNHGGTAQHLMINDDLPNRIASGTVAIKGDVLRFTTNGVVFKGDESQVHEIDQVIFATGYNIRFPFLEDGIISVEKNEVNLFKYMFPTHLKHSTLCVVGLIQPIGSIAPISEQQARLAVRVFQGSCTLPSKELMEKDVAQKRKANQQVYTASERHTIQVDYISYCDEITEFFGASPPLWSLVFSDPRLFAYCLMAPCLPYQYRLRGPHSWSGARQAILTYKSRMYAPFQTVNPDKPFQRESWVLATFASLVITFWLLVNIIFFL